jgi:hypothetical protein
VKQLFPFQAEDAPHFAARHSGLIAHEPRVGKSAIGIEASNIIEPWLVIVVTPASAKENWRIAVEDFRTSEWIAVIV